MSDLVERLRAKKVTSSYGIDRIDVMRAASDIEIEAADEIERLRMALDEIATDDEYRDLTAEEAKAVAKKALAAPTKASGGQGNG